MTGSEGGRDRPQVKVCGLTCSEDAAACAAAGAAAIGLVFYPPSPRNVTREQARQIALALPPQVVPTGVFVNAAFHTIMDRVAHCRLRAVQLHGQEPPELATRLQTEGLIVLKALFMEREGEGTDPLPGDGLPRRGPADRTRRRPTARRQRPPLGLVGGPAPG